MLSDRQHVEAVAIVRRLVEAARAEFPDLDAVRAGQQWLREHHADSEVCLGALNEESVDRDRFDAEKASDSLRIILADNASRARQSLRAVMNERDEARADCTELPPQLDSAMAALAAATEGIA